MSKKISHNSHVPAELTKLTNVLDRLFTIPGTNISIGLDGIVGLIPGVGDAITFLLASYIVYKAALLGMPKLVLARMIWNVLIDGIFGAIPVLGDLFDIVWKANAKNIELIKGVEPSRLTPRTNQDVLRIVQAVTLSMIAIFITGLFFLIKLIYNLLSGLDSGIGI